MNYETVQEKFNKALLKKYNRACIMIRNWHILERLCIDCDYGDNIIELEGEVFDCFTGMCNNLRLDFNQGITLNDKLAVYNIMDVHMEWMRKVNEEWCMKVYGRQARDMAYFIRGADEYTLMYKERRLYTNHSRLNYLIFLKNRLHDLLTLNKGVV